MKNINLAFLVFSLTICLTMLLTTPQVQGEVLLSEEFKYSDGQLIGNNGGFSLDANNQWGGAWQNSVWGPVGSPDSWRISGNGFETNTTFGTIPGANQGIERLIEENQATDTYYFGFDIKFFNNTSSLVVPSLFGVGIDDGNAGGPELSSLMIVEDFFNNGGTQTEIHGNIVSGGITGGTYAGSQFHRVVGKIDFNASGSSDELTLWVNPAAEGDTPDVFHTGQDIGSGLDGKTISVYGRDIYGHPGWQVDNLNITTDFESAQVGALDNEPLSYGHLAMLTHGLQLDPVTDFGDPLQTTFDPVNWADSNFTTADFLDRVHPGSQVTPPAGLPLDNSLPWSRLMPLAQTGANLNGAAEAFFVPSLVRLYIEDEADITIPGIRTAIGSHIQKIHDLYPGVLAHANLATSQIIDTGTGLVHQDMLDYISEAKPDAIIVNHYPYVGSGPDGGSPTLMYTLFERVRQLGLAGHDGSGLTKPIPTGVQSQAFTDGGSTVDRAPSESEIRQQHFAAWAFGMTTSKPYVYDDLTNNITVSSVMFTEDVTGTTIGSPTVTFDHFKEANRQSANLGDTLVRLISTSAHMVMGQHDDGGTVANTTPMAVDVWDAGDDPFITSISATNLGVLNDGLAGDVIVGYFNPLDEQFTDAGTADDDDLYFMIVNGLSDSTGLASATQQSITMTFDFTSDTSITSLQRLSRDTGLVEDVVLNSTGVNTYDYTWTLDGGTGDLFKFNTGSTFIVGPSIPGDFDEDGDVDGADFLTWQRDLGDAPNLAIWQGAYGTGALAAAASAAAVPEPTALLLSLLGIVAMAGSRRRCG